MDTGVTSSQYTSPRTYFRTACKNVSGGVGAPRRQSSPYEERSDVAACERRPFDTAQWFRSWPEPLSFVRCIWLSSSAPSMYSTPIISSL